MFSVHTAWATQLQAHQRPLWGNQTFKIISSTSFLKWSILISHDLCWRPNRLQQAYALLIVSEMCNSWIRPIRFIDFNNTAQHTPLGLICAAYQLACTSFWRGSLIVLMQESKGLKNLQDFFPPLNLDKQRSFLLDPSETAGINIPSGCPWSATTDKRGCCYQPSALKWQNPDSEFQIFFLCKDHIFQS